MVCCYLLSICHRNSKVANTIYFSCTCSVSSLITSFSGFISISTISRPRQQYTYSVHTFLKSSPYMPRIRPIQVINSDSSYATQCRAVDSCSSSSSGYAADSSFHRRRAQIVSSAATQNSRIGTLLHYYVILILFTTG